MIKNLKNLKQVHPFENAQNDAIAGRNRLRWPNGAMCETSDQRIRTAFWQLNDLRYCKLRNKLGIPENYVILRNRLRHTQVVFQVRSKKLTTSIMYSVYACFVSTFFVLTHIQPCVWKLPASSGQYAGLIATPFSWKLLRTTVYAQFS